MSGLRETFVKRYLQLKGPKKSETRPEEQSEKTESCPENLWNEIQLKGPERQKKTQEQNKRSAMSKHKSSDHKSTSNSLS